MEYDDKFDEIENIKLLKKAKTKTEEKKKDPEKQYFDVVIEYLTPVTVKYKVFAESPEEAVKIAEDGKISPTSISKPKLVKTNILSCIVYLYGTVNRLLTVRKR